MGRSRVILTATLLVVSLPAFSHGFSQNPDRTTRGQTQNNRNDRGNRNDHSASNFNKGLRDGGHGGQYYDPRHEQDGYDQRFNQQRQGGIGPGKGALIGGAGGAVLGAIFGGGLKGAIVGGAAGAGVGAVIGEAKQNNQRRNDRYPR